MSKRAKNDTSTWTLELRGDQVRTLQIVLNNAKKDLSSYNKEWLPRQITIATLDDLIDYLCDVCG